MIQTTKRKQYALISCFSLGFVSLHKIQSKTNTQNSLKSNLKLSDNKTNLFLFSKS